MKEYKSTTIHEDELWSLSHNIIGACIDVHRVLGPGLLESVYVDCLCYELQLRGLTYQREASIAIKYKGIDLNSKLRADFIIEDCVILELKAVKEILPVFEAQILSYLKLSNLELGLLINLNVALLKDGIHRYRLNYGKVSETDLLFLQKK